MNYFPLLEKVSNHVLRFFAAHEAPALAYHNAGHTQAVVANAATLARHYQLNDHDYFVVSAACWFHDVGYYIGEVKGHEMAGAHEAEAFLRTIMTDEPTILQVRQCILATAMPQHPTNLLEEIVCDADLYHFGTEDFEQNNKQMRSETMERYGQKIPKLKWQTKTIELLEGHEFKTDYARETLAAQKQKNLEALKQRVADMQAADAAMPETIAAPGEAMETTVLPREKKKHHKHLEQAKKAAADKEKPNRGIETMFRITSANHQRLSDMADNKAHIMVTTNSIILSVLLSFLLRRLEDNPGLVIPTVMLLTVCVTTLVFSILATRPNLPGGRFTAKQIEDKDVNLLFFGNFYKMSLDEYASGMQAMMDDRDFLYGSLVRDVYSQGIVLGHKYKFLRIAYNVFMYGVVVSVLAFLVAAAFFM